MFQPLVVMDSLTNRICDRVVRITLLLKKYKKMSDLAAYIEYFRMFVCREKLLIPRGKQVPTDNISGFKFAILCLIQQTCLRSR